MLSRRCQQQHGSLAAIVCRYHSGTSSQGRWLEVTWSKRQAGSGAGYMLQALRQAEKRLCPNAPTSLQTGLQSSGHSCLQMLARPTATARSILVEYQHARVTLSQGLYVAILFASNLIDYLCTHPLVCRGHLAVGGPKNDNYVGHFGQLDKVQQPCA